MTTEREVSRGHPRTRPVGGHALGRTRHSTPASAAARSINAECVDTTIVASRMIEAAIASAVRKFTDVNAAIALIGGTKSLGCSISIVSGRSSSSPCTYVLRASLNDANSRVSEPSTRPVEIARESR